jgi:hypothetical protein
MDITQTQPERKPPLGDNASRLSLASKWFELSQTCLDEASFLVVRCWRGEVYAAQIQPDVLALGRLAVFCSEVSEAIEGFGLKLIESRTACDYGPWHAVGYSSFVAWLNHCTPIGHRIDVDEQGQHFTRLGLCDLCGARIDYRMSSLEAQRWLAGVEGGQV